jgi:hypothetical protein
MTFRDAVSALALLAMLSACAVAPPVERTAIPPRTGTVEAQPAERPMETPAPVATPTPPPPPQSRYRPGVGTVESASIVSLGSSQSAVGGGTTGPTMGYWLRMEDGTTQSVVQAGERFAVGDRVEISRDGRLMRR